ncbi:hypothetical protein BCU68_14465 [Vibrio sp. 10N.286.49.B3]|uniref:tetratricopeptide repeat protein n=1 Tax=Vibrio sp. 10N.286.49.B3 TaxID=1880855 RepID=UPI000C82B1C5|nr:hypothetical protein [Vibrio sp. 10N.286.49.B3]PMH42209.1 hypothetical protein BCU68_14465 [Vibrio sp. 10N.286.49.B3]
MNAVFRILFSFCSTLMVSYSFAGEIELMPDHFIGAEVDFSQEHISSLAYRAQNQQLSTNERAESLNQLSLYPNQNSLVAIARALKEDNEDIQLAAINGAKPYSLDYRWRLFEPLFDHASIEIRRAITYDLLRGYTKMTQKKKIELEPMIDELAFYLSTQSSIELKRKLANLYRWYGQWESAENIFISLFAIGQNDPQLWLDYADNFRVSGHDQRTNAALIEAIRLHPNYAPLYYSKALTQVRMKKMKQAAEDMEKAAKLADTNSYYWYLTGVLQEEFSVEKATQSLERSYYISGSPEQLYAVCDIYKRHNHSRTESCITELESKVPESVIKKVRD